MVIVTNLRNLMITMAAIVLPHSAVLADEAEEIKIKVKDGGVRFQSGDTTFSIGGRVMLDFDYFDGVHGDGSDTELRRARLKLESENDNWKAKLEISVDELSSDRFKDAYIESKGLAFGNVKIGHFKEPFGFEEMTSSKYTSFIERSMTINAFAPVRNYGVAVGNKDKNMTWDIGYFEAGSNDVDGDQLHAITGRTTFTPMRTESSLLHLGLAFSVRNLNGQEYDISERAEVHLAGKPADSQQTIFADDVTLLGVEAAYVSGPFSAQAEYHNAAVSAINGGSDADYAGYYLLGSYFLTGESRPYKNGKFGKVKPKGDGAWQLAFRYSFLDAEDNMLGTETTNITLGVNYYATTNVRFMFNYIDTEVETATTTQDGDAVSLRAQYFF